MRSEEILPDRHEEIRLWMLDNGRRLSGLAEFLAGLVEQFSNIGLSLDRATLGVPLIHPIAQSSFCAWDIENGATERFLYWDENGLERLKNSPMYAIYTEGMGVDWALENDQAIKRYSIGEELHSAGYTHYLAYALPFSDGSYKALTIQTKSADGFHDHQKQIIQQHIPVIAACVEHYAQRGFAKTLVHTFVGQRAGDRVLEGQVHRGDGEFINAVVWMSDLRGFTQYAMTQTPEALLDAINTYFEIVTEAVSANQGEVLKFIGDAVLGIFPVDGTPAAAVAHAEAAVDQVLAEKEKPDWPAGLDFGVGLHVGEVFFGNIGGRSRLDFTVIGQAVNLVSRIEGLCRELNSHFLVSEDIVAASQRTYEFAGEREVKGIETPVKIYRK